MKVAILNYDYSYLNSVSVRKALLYVQKGKVSIEKWSSNIIRTVSGIVKIPCSLPNYLNPMTFSYSTGWWEYPWDGEI